MSEEFVEFYKRSTKNCTVVLERLDEKLLCQYLQKCDSNTTEMVGFVDDVINQWERNEIHSNDFSATHSYSEGNMGQKLKKFVLKNKFKQRKRKIKSLCSSNDESPSETIRSIESIKNKTGITVESTKNVKSPPLLTRDEGRIVIDKTDNSEKTPKSPKTKEVHSWVDCKTSRSLPKRNDGSEFELKCNEITLTNILSSNFKEIVDGKYADHEIEVIQEITKPCVLQKKVSNVEGTLTKSISKNADVDNEQYFEEDEYDIREDNEDDRITIIFERSSHEEADSKNVFEINEREVECPMKKFKCNEITNWKQEKLTNLKENILEQDKAKFRQAENRNAGQSVDNVESPSGEKFVGKPTTNECVRGYYLQKVCTLVKRLHELNRIISQLQKESPKNGELAFHFSKVIRVQKENFFKEIKKCQKPIIECYEKLLAFYGNSSNEIISKISQLAFLSAEDVRNIISRCFLLNDFYEIQGNNNASSEKQEKRNVLLQPKTFDSLHRKFNENLLKLLVRRKVYTDNHLVTQTHSFFPLGNFNYQPELTEKPTNERGIPWVLPARKNEMSHAQRLSDHGLRSLLPSYNAYQIKKQSESHICIQQKNQDQRADPRPRKPSQHDLRYPGFVSWCSDPLIHNSQPSSRKTVNSHPQNVKPDSSCSFLKNPAVSLSQRKKSNPEPLPPRNSRHSFLVQHFYFPNCTQQKSVSVQSSQTNMEFLNFGPPAVQNISTCTTVRQRNNLQRGSFAFPSNIHNRAGESQRQARRPLEDYLNESVRFSNRKLLKQKQHELLVSGEEIFGKHCNIEVKSRTELKNTSSEVAQEVLDPTVPQKLTMKNCRLQAEPTLSQETEEKPLKTSRRLSPLKSFKEETKSRVYVCAQNYCEMPGLRICKGCQSIIYCSETCQLKHWALKHKTECYQLRELRGA